MTLRITHFLTIALLALSPLAAQAQQAGDGATVSTRSQAFGDSDPVTWNGRAPGRYAVHGIDIARYQGPVNWREARRAGVTFAFIKATEGGDMLDPMFADHWRGAGKAGVLRGAYHFYYFCTEPLVQARWFIRNVPRRKGMLPPVLDMEWNPYSPTCTKRPEAKEVRRQMKVFLDTVERHYGQRPVIYTTPNFYRDAGLKHMQSEEFWLRSTAKTLNHAYPGQDWTFWQYSGTGIVPGIAGDVDLNTFHGSRAAWANWVKARQH